MKYLYDLHIHSALSPCADNDMTPVNIVAYAAAMGLEIIAISDHNSASNVRAAMEVGEALSVTVVPAVELQTNEDIHVLCYFPDADSLEAFLAEIPFAPISNRPDVFGEQLIVNSDDEIIGKEERLLLTAADISEVDVRKAALRFGGVAVPAHVDRLAFGMVAVLGAVPDEYTAVELAEQGDEAGFPGKHVLRSSDAHTLEDIGKRRCFIELEERSAAALCRLIKNFDTMQRDFSAAASENV